MTRELWVRFLAGETLSEEEQKALLAALEADPALREELLEDAQFDGALRALGDARRSGAAFAASVVDCVGPERDATRFIRKVEARLAETPDPDGGAPRDSRSALPRVSRRFFRRDPESAPGWKAALVAAGAFVAIVLLATALSRPAPTVAGLPKAKETAPRFPEPEPRAPESAPAPDARPRPDPSTPKREEPELREPAPFVVPPPKLAEARPPAPERAPAPAAETRDFPAPAPGRSEAETAQRRGPRVLSVADQVYYGKTQARVEEGVQLDYGQVIYTAGRGKATLRYEDGTTVEVKPGTLVRDLSGSKGLHLEILVGDLRSEIRPQPAGLPMLFSTPHGKATIVGTVIRLSVAKDPAVGTTLAVDEGRVNFERGDGAAVEVVAGQAVTASAALRELKPRVSFPEQFTIRFGPTDAPKGPGVYLDSGDAFSAARGYGWDATRDGQTVPNAKQPDGSPVKTGRRAEWKLDPRHPLKREDLKSSIVVAGWGEHAEHWWIELPNGFYEVTVCVGDSTFEQGPHYVVVEGVAAVNDVLTRPPKLPHYENTVAVEVKDGKLDMRVGGSPRPRRSSDTSKDTLLHYLVIKRAPAK